MNARTIGILLICSAPLTAQLPDLARSAAAPSVKPRGSLARVLFADLRVEAQTGRATETQTITTYRNGRLGKGLDPANASNDITDFLAKNCGLPK